MNINLLISVDVIVSMVSTALACAALIGVMRIKPVENIPMLMMSGDELKEFLRMTGYIFVLIAAISAMCAVLL
jgi:hypothetical protein